MQQKPSGLYNWIQLFSPHGFGCIYSTLVKTALSQNQMWVRFPSTAGESTGLGGKGTFHALTTLLHHRGIHEQEASAFCLCVTRGSINNILHMCMCARTRMALKMEYRGQAFNLYTPSTTAHTSPGLIIASAHAIQKR
jgi:hypothetical protein